jgi:sucrose-6-phosphate hydrolase SacC (GH32 family)
MDIRIEMDAGTATDFGLTVRGQAVRYSVPQQTLTVGSDSAPIKLSDNRLCLRILVDRPSLEVFADIGQVTISSVYLEGNTDDEIRPVADGGNMRVSSLLVSRLEAIWPG